jgi:phosphatidylglycerol:prolipoprotein diacylglycerol transferase
MHPQLTGLFSLILISAILVGSTIHFAILRHERIPLRPMLRLFLLLVLSGVAGAKLYSVLIDGPAVLFQVDSGYRQPGGIVAMIVVAPLLGKLRPKQLSLARWADLLIPGAAFSLAIYRAGCFLAGCCSGTVSKLPWALRFPRYSEIWKDQLRAGLIQYEDPFSLPVHPLQLYFLGLLLMLGCVALVLIPRQGKPGKIFLGFLAVHEGAKFFLEYLRFPASPALQWSSLAIASTAIAVLAWDFLKVQPLSEARP